MKNALYSSIFNPLYVLVSGSLGVFIAIVMFKWNYPLPGDEIGLTFIQAQPFLIWLFLIAILCCLNSIFILPSWGLLIWLFQNKINGEDPEHKRNTALLLLFEAIFISLAVGAVLLFGTISRFGFDFKKYVPEGHALRMQFMYGFTFLSCLPILLGMLLIHAGAQQLSFTIEKNRQNPNKLFQFIDELLFYRNLLQNYLMIIGIILSMIPITTAGLRAILIALDPANDKNFPITNAILFGLVFTILLLFIYIPSHLALTEVSRKLRDGLCPLTTLDALQKEMEQRKLLDELLQTNIGITQNLKAGLITFAPLATSLLTSILKIDIPL